MVDRTRAERRIDELSREARELRAIKRPNLRQRNRLFEIESKKLPSAWRAVNQMREGIR